MVLLKALNGIFSACPILPSYLTFGWCILFSQVTTISDWSNVCQPEINPSVKYKA